MLPIRFAQISAVTLKSATDDARLATAVYTRQERTEIATALRQAHARGVVSGKELTRALAGTGRDHRVAALGKKVSRRVRKLVAEPPSLARVSSRSDPRFDTPAHRATIASLVRSLVRAGAYDPTSILAGASVKDWTPAESLEAAIDAYTVTVGKRMATALGLDNVSVEDMTLKVNAHFCALNQPDGPLTHAIVVAPPDDMVAYGRVADGFQPHAQAVSEALSALSLRASEIIAPLELARGEAWGAWLMENLEAYVTTAFDEDGNFRPDDELTEQLCNEHGIELDDPEQAARVEKALRFLRDNPVRRAPPSGKDCLSALRSAAASSSAEVADGLRTLERAVVWARKRRPVEGLVVGFDFFGGGEYGDGEGMPCTIAFDLDLSGYEESFAGDMHDHCMQTGAGANTSLTAPDCFAALTVALEDCWVISLLAHALGAASE